MADDNQNPAARVRGGVTDAEAAPSESVVSSSDRAELLAQATRFLTSAKISESASDKSKSDFLRSKGLTDEEIAQAIKDSRSPVEAGAASLPAGGDEDPFDRAARQFDDPIHADSLSPPPKSYPKSPLALYYDAPSQQHASTSTLHAGRQDPSLTRYQVLLRFFRTLSFMMMLGGGVTALLVSAYRVYILPKITAMFDARSIVLRHHITLFDKLRDQVTGLATYVPKQIIAPDATPAANGASARKGVLKKVHFNDHAAEKQEKDDEGVKATQHDDKADESTTTDKVITPGTDVVIDSATTPAKNESEADTTAEGEAEAPQPTPIDLTEPIRSSLSKLAEALKANMSSSALSAPSASSSAPIGRASRSTTVHDAGSGSDDWEDDEEDEEASDDGLEFDPYGAYQKKLKHTQATSTATSSTKTPASLSGLKSAIASLNADISTHAFAATSSSSNMYSSSFRYMPTSGTANTTGDGNSSGTESPKFGDLGQVKAEIRSLKGLLLSRRNFPSYAARPPPPPFPSSASSELRSTSAVV